MEKAYLCIDLKSFYASVECIERELDPLTTNLVVADSTRTEKTICLAVTPSLKAYGIPGRARLFEVVQKVNEVNQQRKQRAPGKRFTGESFDAVELERDAGRKLSYIIAPPRMAHYMETSTRIYDVYLKYIAPEDILVYSIDEVFMDITQYLKTYGMTARELAMTIIRDVLTTTGITATAGIGTNLYLAKIAMDITAKKMPPDKDGVRIAQLDEMTYRRELWNHRPLTDFWRVGRGYAKKLEEHRLCTMGDVARASLNPYGRGLLKKLFGINSKMLVDHAWGYEPCTMEEAKAYTPENKSVSTGQVLQCPYSFQKARVVVWEMLELLSLDLVEKRIATDQIVLTIGYDIENLTDPDISQGYQGEVKTDYYGRKVPKHAHGTANLGRYTNSARLIAEGVLKLYDEIVNPKLLIRRITIAANHLLPESSVKEKISYEQMDLFTDYRKLTKEQEREKIELQKERSLQETMIEIKSRYGKNAVLKGASLQEGATARERNKQIGGHKA